MTTHLFRPAASLPAPKRVALLDVDIDNLTTAETLDRIDAALGARRSMPVAFVNADCLNKAVLDAAYLETLSAMALVLPDGIGVKLGARMNSLRIRDNVNGTDLFPLLCERLAHSGRRLFLYGAAPGVADGVAAWVKQHHPEAVVCGTLDGFTASADDVVRRVRDAQPDVLLVALGAPLQERWMAAHGAHTGVPVVMGVGGLFDFYSGRMPRAPMWMRRLSVEWVYRLWQEPRRMWRRYLIGNVVFLVRVWRHRDRTRSSSNVEANA